MREFDTPFSPDAITATIKHAREHRRKALAGLVKGRLPTTERQTSPGFLTGTTVKMAELKA